MQFFRNPLRNPTEVDILGIILIMAGVFLSVAGFEGVYDLQRIGIDDGRQREVLMWIAYSGCASILAGITFFIHKQRQRSSDVLDDDHFSDE